MSLGEADAKFPNQGGSGEAPEPTPENPGAVYPKSDEQAAPSSQHFDPPSTTEGPDNGPPSAQPQATTAAVPGSGDPAGATSGSSFAAKDLREEQDNPSVNQDTGGGFQKE